VVSAVSTRRRVTEFGHVVGAYPCSALRLHPVAELHGTRLTVPCLLPSSARRVGTIRTAAAFLLGVPPHGPPPG
jgi:hypothetical protein